MNPFQARRNRKRNTVWKFSHSHVQDFRVISHNLSTVAPSRAGSSSFQSQEMPRALNRAMMVSAISSKFVVASAKMVGPAPDRQIPSNPGCVLGFMDCNVSDNPGMRPLRYGWWTLSCIAR
jgi:hypothetical protein